MRNFLDVAFTPEILELHEKRGVAGLYDPSHPVPDALTPDERTFITERNSFYMATVNEDGWPYVQHRGGDTGFVSVLGPTTIGWAERSGNRQYLGTGNIVANGRISLIFVDYPNRGRLKLFGEATLHLDPSDELIEAIGAGSLRTDGVITMEVAATNWNCPKYITPRFDQVDVERVIETLQNRIAELEAERLVNGDAQPLLTTFNGA